MSGLKNHTFLLIIMACILSTACSQYLQDDSAAATNSWQDPHTSITPTAPIFEQNLDLQATLSIYHSWSEEKRTALNAILREFSKRYPDVYFDITFIPPDELHNLFSVEAAQGRGAVILLGPAEWGPGFHEAGLIQDLDQVIEPSKIENINPAALEASQYQGKLISLPYSISGALLYRNQGILTIQADNFNELVMLAESASQGETAGAILERSFYFSGGHLFGLGGKLMDENGYPAFVTPEGENWLTLIRSFQYTGEPVFLSDLDLEEFKAGRAGWIIEGSWKMRELAEAIGLDRLNVDPWPEVETRRLSGFLQSDNLYLNSNANGSTLEAGKAFLEFFISQPSQAHLVEIELIPSLLYVDMPRTEMSPVIDQAMIAMASGTAYPVSPVMDTYLKHMDRAIQSYLERGLSARDALDQASSAIIEDLESVETTPTP